MARYQDLSSQMEGLELDEEENTAFVIEGDVEEDITNMNYVLLGVFLRRKESMSEL